MPQPRALTGLLPFTVAQDREDATLTSYAGIPLAVRAFSILGLDRIARKELLLKERDRGPTDAQWAALGTMIHLAGGESPAELDRLKEERGLVRAWPLLDRVSARSFRDHLARFDDAGAPRSVQGRATIVPETPGLAALGAVRDGAVHEVQRRRPVRSATIECDASIIESWRRSALFHYDGGKGYQPLFAYWVEQRLIVRDQFRDGNVPAGFDMTSFVLATFDGLPGEVKDLHFRSDSAAYDHELLRALDRRGIRFAVSADVGDAIRRECRALEPEAWKRLRDREGKETDREVSETAYVPEESVTKPGEKPFRYIVVRIRLKERQLELFEKAVDGYLYFAIVTNREGTPEEINNWQRERCGSIEVAIDFLKNDTGAGVMTSQKFGANAAWLRYGVIALNLLEAMKVLFPRELAALHAFSRPETMRRRFVQRAGRFIRHAGKLVLLLASGLSPLAKVGASLGQLAGG